MSHHDLDGGDQDTPTVRAGGQQAPHAWSSPTELFPSSLGLVVEGEDRLHDGGQSVG